MSGRYYGNHDPRFANNDGRPVLDSILEEPDQRQLQQFLNSSTTFNRFSAKSGGGYAVTNRPSKRASKSVFASRPSFFQLILLSIASCGYMIIQHRTILDPNSNHPFNKTNSTALVSSFQNFAPSFPSTDNIGQRPSSSSTRKRLSNDQTITCTIGQTQITLPQMPHFIIAGAQKSGTTALFNFLSRHPSLQPSNKTEAHFFDWHYPGPKHVDEWLQKYDLLRHVHTEDELQCAIRSAYTKEWLGEDFNFDFLANSTLNIPGTAHNSSQTLQHYKYEQPTQRGASSIATDESSHPSVLYYEKTPSYLFLSNVPARIKRTCPWKPKIIIILRNPVDRAYSHFQVGHKKQGLSFEELIDAEIKVMQNLGLSTAPSRHTFLSHLDDLYAKMKVDNKESAGLPNTAGSALSAASLNRMFAIPNLTITQSHDINKKVYRRVFANNFLQRGMYAIHLEKHWTDHFPLGEKLLVIQWEEFRKSPAGVYGEILEFLNVPSSGMDADFFAQEHNSHGNPDLPMDELTRSYLEYFFRPYNEMLERMIDGKGFAWKGVWA